MADFAETDRAVANETSVTSACYSCKTTVMQPSHKLHVSSLTASPDTENPKENNSDL
ncbi:UNVERIFIED_ORG: hypothetical protein GGE64_003006 [Rhizobium etli]|uniref:Uncharacterized protein n=1 Tax=Rhizobium etli TaxID=29449 RepID=A0A7W7EC36_RHIET|nr:hypothetical protein [Rhizobium etli]MBB4533373.1 hypothetical protein [Rhizobium etli]